MALQCLILLGGCWFLVQRQRLRFAAAEKLEESRADSRLRLLAEGLRKTRIVRGYGMEDFEHEHFQHHLDKFRTNVLHVLNMQHYLRLAVGFLVLACVAAVALSGRKQSVAAARRADVPHLVFDGPVDAGHRREHAASPGRVLGTSGAAVMRVRTPPTVFIAT